MAWFLLVIAGLMETGWAIGLKYTDGFTRLWPSVFTVAGIVVSMVLLSIAARTLPIGTAYAVWVGIGTAGTILPAEAAGCYGNERGRKRYENRFVSRGGGRCLSWSARPACAAASQ